MIDKVIHKLDELYAFTGNSFGLVVKREVNEIKYPFKLLGNDYKQLINFQKYIDFNYWYVKGEISVEKQKNLYNVKSIYELTYPMRIFVCSKEVTPEDIALRFFKNIEKLKLSEKKALGVYNMSINYRNYDIERESVLNKEFGTIPKLPAVYSVCTIDVDIVLTVDKECIDVC